MATKAEPAGLKLRVIAADRLKAVLGGEHFTPLSAADLTDGRDRALANRLITTALRRHGQINHMIVELLDRGLPPRSGSFEAVLRLSLAQLVFLPDLGAHSALFLAVEALKRDGKARHLTGLMNAVLRRAQANSARYGLLPDDLLLPPASAGAWRAAYGDDAVADIAEALVAGAPLDLTLRDDDADLVEALGARPIMADTVRLDSRDRSVEDLPGYTEGRWWVQDAAASVPARLLKLSAPGRVLDLCAAPGGKTAQLVKAGHIVTALDSDVTRLERLSENLKRLGMTAETILADATTHSPPEPFDGVLLDAPCSATGTFRRHPEVIWHRSDRDIANRVRLQRQMLRNAVQSLAPGGTLIYCVCSLEPAEGEEQAAWIAAELEMLAVDPVSAGELPELADAVTPEGTVRILPGMIPGGIDGFFVARYRRR